MSQTKKVLGLDIGAARIGVALADTIVGIASPQGAILVNGKEIEQVQSLVNEHHVDTIVVGYPRNQSGDTTDQTKSVEQFAQQLQSFATVVFQDESLTSVMAEDRLKSRGGGFSKGDIDAEAAAIILQDYMELHR